MSNMTLKPRVSEKAYGLSQSGNVYVFIVPDNANKHTVADAVAEQFKVTVLDVNMANVKAKTVRTFRKRRFISGQRSDFKKAYVTVKAGDNIPIFAAEEEAEKKAEKAAAKAAKKEKK
jgi:large subunit ribosomal protein L23